jgi:integrase
MPSVFKKIITGYRTPEGRKCKKCDALTTNAAGKKKLRPGYRRVTTKSRNWYGQYRDAKGQPRCVPLCPDKAAAQQLLSKLITDAAKGKHGLMDPYAEHRTRPLADHLADFKATLEAKGDTAEHVEQTVSRVRALLDGVGAEFVDDLDAARVSAWLTALRRPGTVPVTVPAGKRAFTPGEAAHLLGISGAAVRAAVKRLRLEATGHGKARRYPRATVEALAGRMAGGASPQTVNHYIRAVRSFVRWLVKDDRIPSNPLKSVEMLNAQTDVRHGRRELSAEELGRLLEATRASDRTFRGLTGTDRFTLYAMACGTGFRASALASLTPESFDLEGQTPTVTLAARRNKNRKPRVQPMPLDVAELLRAYLNDRPAGQPVWGGTWASDHRGAEMLRGDLETAGIPYVIDGPDGPLYADFHALRHTYLTLLGRGGVDLRTAQELADHSSPVLTARYSHRRLHDLAGAVEKLPSFLPRQPDAEEGRLRATGTDGLPACTGLAQTPDGSGQQRAAAVSGQGAVRVAPEMTQPPVSQGFGHRQAVPVSPVLQRGRRDSNPQPPDRQSGTLTN